MQIRGSVDGPVLLRPSVLVDERGYFFEAYSARHANDALGQRITFVQDNQSRSHNGVLRGLHYQLPPRSQGKLIRVIRGAVCDIVVDLRRSSQTFGEWHAFDLSESNSAQLWVPPGFAHGFMALSDPTDVIYKVTEYYSPEHDRSIRWDDPDIGIEWPLDGNPILSDKDANAPYLRDAEVFA
jgi:dTDP-4-dehydrorhamnose 3,5-epimerase